MQIILGLVLPPAILLLDFKSEAEMRHVPQSQEAMLFTLDPARPGPPPEQAEQRVRLLPRCRIRPSTPRLTVRLDSQGSQDAERGPSALHQSPGSVANVSTATLTCLSWIKRPYEFYTAPVVKFWFHTVGAS